MAHQPVPPPPTSTEGARAPALRRLGRVELTALLAMSMALGALGIDVLLPVFPELRETFGLVADPNATAQLITTYFIGLAAGQLVYGPVSDRYGRRPVLYVGYVIYLLGAVLSVLAPTFELLLLARLVWGLGAAGPRSIVLAIIRDTWSGDRMARAMSFVMAVFILVPVVAPTLGAVIGDLGGWRWVFGFCVAMALVMAVWGLRLPETLDPANRRELRWVHVAEAGRTVLSDRRTVGYTLAMTALYGVFTSWIASSEIIISETFGQGERFPLIFGALAGALGIAMLANAWLVERVGSRRLSWIVLRGYVVVSALLLVVALATDGVPPFWLFVTVMLGILGSHALLIPNLNSMAMEPMGSVAGTAAAVTGTVQIAVGALLGALLDRAFDGTITPMAVGFLGYGVLAVLLTRWARYVEVSAETEDVREDAGQLAR